MDNQQATYSQTNLPPQPVIDWAVFVGGIFGITVGWIVSCGALSAALWSNVANISIIDQSSERLQARLISAIAIMCSALAITGLTTLIHASLFSRSLPRPVQRKWRWATLLGSLAYWLASWLFLHLIGQTDMLGLVSVLDASDNVISETIAYLVVAALGILAGSTSMGLLALPQWWAIRDHARNARLWPIAMMLANGIVVALIYLCLATIWRYGGWG